MPLELCTVDDLKGSSALQGFLEGMAGAEKYADILLTIIKGVSKRFESPDACNRTFENYTVNQTTEYFDGDKEKSFIIVKNPPITSVTSLHDDLDRVYGSAALIDADDYVAYDSGRVELDGGSFSTGLKNIKIIYKGGYTEATIPDDLKLACMLQSAFIFKRRKEIGLNAISGVGGSLNISTPMKLLPEVKAILRAYKIWRI